MGISHMGHTALAHLPSFWHKKVSVSHCTGRQRPATCIALQTLLWAKSCEGRLDALNELEVQGLVTGGGIQQPLLGFSLMQKETAEGYLASAPSSQKWAGVNPHSLAESDSFD